MIISKRTFRQVLIFSFVLVGFANLEAHPLKLSITDIALKNNRLTMNIKLFYDDLEAELTNYYKKEVKIYDQKLEGERLRLIDGYIGKQLEIYINGTKIIFFIKKACLQNNQVLVEYETKVIRFPKISKVLINNSLLFNSIPEQKNIINLLLLEGKSTETLLFENENNTKTRELNY